MYSKALLNMTILYLVYKYTQAPTYGTGIGSVNMKHCPTCVLRNESTIYVYIDGDISA